VPDPERRTVEVNGDVIAYAVIRSHRRRKTLEINVDPIDGVRVAVPARTPIRRIEEFVESRAGWIRRRQADWTLANPAPRAYETGETLQLLGAPIQLRIAPGDGSRATARLEGGWLEVTLPPDGESQPQPGVVRAVEGWYRNLAGVEFLERVTRYAGIAGVPMPRVLVATQKRRWGSCSTSGVLRLNWRLMMAPSDVVDYVVVHEVCHLRHPHHQRPFWEAVADLMPEYRGPRERLLRQGALYRL
jgi:predicted metal-dependent hydrolase